MFMKHKMFVKFLFCGVIGWCLECLWTGLGSLIGKNFDRKLTCHTSLWMFPIYGMAAFIYPISKKIKSQCTLLRGGVYSLLILITELVTGELLKKFGACPWDYSKSKFDFDGVIRFDYIPIWFVVGLLYEKILNRNNTKTDVLP
ncbi:putative ABC transporter permease [[Clostridium] polysaccharolyticum]|uniref:putative ABC transporter permease n=1 Tax=[Clostridium] polysaccharolyticum TaxID=29364 RepID=UPI002E8E060D|nr:hypothetical protein [[Clostridium] polysaccharolyticum]